MMRRNVLIFNHLCKASQELNGIFSFPIFILLTGKFISVVAVAFAFIYNKFIRSYVMLNNQSWAFIFFLLFTGFKFWFFSPLLTCPLIRSVYFVKDLQQYPHRHCLNRWPENCRYVYFKCVH